MPRNPERSYHMYRREFLNMPGKGSHAHLIMAVEDTSGKENRENSRYWTEIEFSVADCGSQIHLEFDLSDYENRKNAMFKAVTLRDALDDFVKALKAEFPNARALEKEWEERQKAKKENNG